MTVLALLLAAMSLTLFPVSLAIAALLDRLSGPWRAAMLALWPLPGALALAGLDSRPPDWLIALAMLSALFHAWRGLGAADAREWLSLVALSAWPMLWAGAQPPDMAVAQALALGLPLAAASLVVDAIERHFGAAHAALDLRLAHEAPRLAGLFFVAVLAATAMPLSPSFFAVLSLVAGQGGGNALTSLALLGVWFLWSWSGARLVHGLVPGASRRVQRGSDVSSRPARAGAGAFAVLAAAGLIFGGILL